MVTRRAWIDYVSKKIPNMAKRHIVLVLMRDKLNSWAWGIKNNLNKGIKQLIISN